jgi:hypothetical protein
MKRLVLTAVLLVGACQSPIAPGRANADVYDFALPTMPPRVVRWPSGSTIRVFVAGGADVERHALLEAALDAGAAAWNRLATYGEFRIERTTHLVEANVVVRWSDAESPVDTRDCPPVVVQAVTTFCVDFTATPLRLTPFPLLSDVSSPSRVTMLVTILGTGMADAERVRRLVTHELGHVLGLARHSPVETDLMWGGEPMTSQPTQRDASSVQVLYHMRADISP